MFLVGWFSFRHSFQLVTLPFAAKGFQLCPGGGGGHLHFIQPEREDKEDYNIWESFMGFIRLVGLP